MSNQHLMRIFWDTDMRGRHEALKQKAKDAGVNFEKLKPGDLLAFVNAARDRVMVLAPVSGEADSFGVLAYYRSPHGRIDEFALQYIPEAFGGGKLNMAKATEKAVLQRLAKKKLVAKA